MTITMTSLLFLHLFLILVCLPSSTPTPTTTLPLSQFNNPPQPLDIYHHLNHLATTSLARARHLKNPHPEPLFTTATTTTTRLSPHTYGGYSISLKFGTPPQTLPFIMDTGSNFMWFPCTHNYICNNCSLSSDQSKQTNIPTFIPKLSSSAKIVGCLNPKCGWIHTSKTRSRCSSCNTTATNCTDICPAYMIMYGSGSTTGLALLDTLHLNDQIAPDFLVGCSLLSSRQPAGIAGFGRGDPSLPGQLGLSKFSYCLLSHRFDDTPMTSYLKLTGKSHSGEKLTGVRYTKFVKNPKVLTHKEFSVYYYVNLKRILVGGKRVKFPRQFLSIPDLFSGLGGTIIDSGMTFTYMARPVFEPLALEMEMQAKEYKRAEETEKLTGLRPCFNVSGLETVSLPSLRFRFKGGAEMVLPLENYFSVAGNGEAVCMTIVTDPPGREEMNGPKVILGNYQQQNFYVEYDLKHNRFGFKQQKCG